MFTELNDVYGLDLDVNPDVTRDPSPNTSNGQNRLVFVGASHMARLTEAATAAGADSIYVGYPGWVAAKDSLAEAARKLGGMTLGEGDVVILDLFSNSAFMGTDADGLPCRAVRNRTDSRYHILGELQAAPKTVFERIVGDASGASGLAAATSGCKTVLISPIPRYLASKCCSDSTHLTNWDKEGLQNEMHRAGDMADLATSASSAMAHCTRFNILELFGGADSDLSEAKTTGGQSIWQATDPVHLSPAAYGELASTMQDMLQLGADEARPRKRARLESVVPAAPGGDRGRQGRVRPPLWVSGMTSRGATAGRGGAGRGAGRGGGRMGYRDASRGFWNPGVRAMRGGYGRYSGRGRGRSSAAYRGRY